jgi:Zn-dependent M28 family amino/carboxypeptidase
MNSAVRAGRQRVAKFEAETPAYPVAVLSESSAKELIGTTKNSFVDMQNGNIASFEFAPEATADLTMSVDRQSAYIANVLGMVPGSDPKLKSEYVFVGAHLDHLGISARATGDNIYNGADDDGSGSASILAMARAISQGPKLKRSVVFIWHAAEEAGLLGSRYFNQYPTVPQKDITAMINIDMIGRSRAVGDTKAANEKLTTASEIYVVGSNKLSSELKPIVDAADQRDKTLAFNYEYDKPNDPERLYYRSDHYNYAVKGIPVIFFFDGVHEDYHRVTDEIAKIDFDKMRRVGNNVLQLLTTFANRKVRMKVDLPLDQAK